MIEQLISFEIAKLGKEKGFNIETIYFYTIPNSKMFGLDEKGRSYPISNTSKKLYKVGEYATLNSRNVIFAPTQSLLAKWLREVHKLHITIIIGYGEITWYSFIIQSIDSDSYIQDYEGSFNTYEEALEQGLISSLKLI